MRGLAIVIAVQLVVVASARADEPAPVGGAKAMDDNDADDDVLPPSHDDTPPQPERFHEDNEFGPVILIEGIEITGNTVTQTEIIRRALPIAPGDIMHASDKRMRDARFKILALGFFRDVTLAMKKGSARGQVVIEIRVIERGTIVLNRLWFGSNSVSPYWFGTDLGERNLLGLGIAFGGGVIYAASGKIVGSRDQWAGELRAADGALRGTRWGANGALTLVHGSEVYRVSGDDDNTSAAAFHAFPYRRFGGRAGLTYDATSLSRISAGIRAEQVSTELPVAPTRTLPDGRAIAVDLHLDPGQSRIMTAGLGFDRDTRPDPVLPHSGGRVTASAEVGSAALGGNYDFATLFARYEHWWPLGSESHTLGIRIAGGVVIGDAPRFDRIHISDVDHMLTPRALGLVLSTAAPLDILKTKPDKPSYGEVGGSATLEYAARLFRGSGKKRVYGGDWFIGAGLWSLAETDDLRLRDSGVWKSLPIDVYADAGVRIDTDVGIFELHDLERLGATPLKRAVLLLVMVVVGAAPARAEDDTESVKMRFVERSDDLTASTKIQKLFDEAAYQALNSGFPSTIVINTFVYPRGEPDPIAARQIQRTVVYDLWDENYVIRLDERAKPVKVKYQSEALKLLTSVDDMSVARLVDLPYEDVFYLKMTVLLNPVDKKTLAEVQRWLSQGTGGGLDRGGVFFGSFVSVFVHPKIADADRVLQLRSQPFYRPKP